MIDGEGLSTEELFTEAFAQMRKLRNRMQTRRGREKALELVTELFLSVEAISRRVGAVAFVERPVNLDEDEDHAMKERVSMAELLPPVNDFDDHDDLDDVHDLDELRARILELKKSRLDYFRIFLAYFTKGCRQERDVTNRVLACVRRVSPHLLEQFGLSQADVGRKLGQQRATVSTREKKQVEAVLKRAGAKGVLSNGARGDGTRAACARAAKGNSSRATGKARREMGAEFRAQEKPIPFRT